MRNTYILWDLHYMCISDSDERKYQSANQILIGGHRKHMDAVSLHNLLLWKNFRQIIISSELHISLSCRM